MFIALVLLLTAIEMWFRVMDLDGDGFISLYELEYFYEAQLDKMRLLGVEECSVLDCICQVRTTHQNLRFF